MQLLSDCKKNTDQTKKPNTSILLLPLREKLDPLGWTAINKGVRVTISTFRAACGFDACHALLVGDVTQMSEAAGPNASHTKQKYTMYRLLNMQQIHSVHTQTRSANTNLHLLIVAKIVS